MAALLGYLLPRNGVVILLAAGALLAFGVQEVRLKNARSGEAHANAKLQAEQRAEAARQTEALHASARASAQTAQVRIRIRTITKTLLQKVPLYVPAAADAECVLPLGFVRLHDAAAQGVPTPAGGPDQAPSGVTLSAIAETVVANYGVAYDWRAETLAWRDWYVRQAAIWGR